MVFKTARPALAGAGLALAFAASATAQPMDAPASYGGDLMDRPRLTGDWGGTRDELSRMGIDVGLDLTQVLQGNAAGGKRTGVAYGGLADYKLGFDSGKSGLWPGGFFNIHAESNFGGNANGASGSFLPANTVTFLPSLSNNTTTTALMNATAMQFATEWTGVMLGKIDTVDGQGGEFNGNYRTQFMNAGFAWNWVNALVPVSTFGGGLVLLPTPDSQVTFSALGPQGTPTSNDVGAAFDDGVVLVGQGKTPVKPFGLLGHQQLGFTWSNTTRASLTQDSSNIADSLLKSRFPRLANPGPALTRILQRFYPQLLTPTQPLNTESSTWTVFYNADQYLWQPEGHADRGIGLFFGAGTSDGNPNPIKYSFSAGIGGKGIVPGRPGDSFGIGWSRAQYSDDFVPFLRQRLNLGLNNDDAVEAYYNAAITPALGLTLDLQAIDPGLQKQLNSAGQLEDVHTAFLAGLRLYARF